MRFTPHILRRDSIFVLVKDVVSRYQGKGGIVQSLPKKRKLTSDHFISLPTFTKYIRLIHKGNNLILKCLLRRGKSKWSEELDEAETQCSEGMNERK